jgi:carbamoyltransferase
LINKFKEITSFPILVNTSFNVRGEPIVCSIEDAFRCFMGTDLDILVCENFILHKEEQSLDLLKDYKNQFEKD